MAESEPFKYCSICNKIWMTRDEFVHDPEVSLLGYQPNFVVVSRGLFLFNHDCGSTMSLNVGTFADYYHGPVFSRSLFGSSDCQGLCLHRNDLRPCPQECECAYVRSILERIRELKEDRRRVAQEAE